MNQFIIQSINESIKSMIQQIKSKMKHNFSRLVFRRDSQVKPIDLKFFYLDLFHVHRNFKVRKTVKNVREHEMSLFFLLENLS